MVSTPKRIGIDIDGVCCDWNSGFRNLICQLHGVNKQPPVWPPTEWHWPNTYCSKSEVNECWRYIDSTGGDWWADLEALNQEETGNALMDLLMQGHDVYFLTARRGEGVKQATETWFVEELNLWPTVLVGLKPEDKFNVGMALNLDVIVDDRIENCLPFAREHGDEWGPEHICLFNQPYNQTFDPKCPELYTSQLKRINSLREVVELCGR